MDVVHPTQATKITSGLIRKGVDKLIKTIGSRTRLNIVGAIRLGHLEDAVIEQYEKTVNGVSSFRSGYRGCKKNRVSAYTFYRLMVPI